MPIAIARHETMNGIEVPLDSDGRYLDWNQSDGHEASYLTSPHGELTFLIGDRTSCFNLDFALLPDGRVALWCFFRSGDRPFDENGNQPYIVVEPEAAHATAQNFTHELLRVLARLGVLHDRKFFEQDPGYYSRAVAAATGVEPYVGMHEMELMFDEPATLSLVGA